MYIHPGLNFQEDDSRRMMRAAKMQHVLGSPLQKA